MRKNLFNFFGQFNLKVTIEANIKQTDFHIFKPCRFCGIIIKYQNCSLTYFNSGSVIIVGLKNIHELNLYVKKYETFFDYCKKVE